MDRMRIVAGLALSFLLLFPAVSEGKRKKTTSDEDFKLEGGSSKHRVVQETMDLSGYGTIDEIKRINLQNQLKRMIMQHNERQKTRRSKVKNIRERTNPSDPTRSKPWTEDFNVLDLGGYDFITETDRQLLEKRLDDMIEKHNLYAKGKLKRPTTVRFRNR
ncbi:MAG: hypothetical protein E7055_04260 [Lentisphaerae bacterium]|nr:hypothetical protein [Lentisphaerota bacterium]